MVLKWENQYHNVYLQARELYAISRDLLRDAFRMITNLGLSVDKVRLLYNRSQPTARIVVRSKEDLEVPLNMTHCYLRAMSPIHIKCASYTPLLYVRYINHHQLVRSRKYGCSGLNVGCKQVLFLSTKDH